MGLDATELTLIGQAYMRNGSPTDELLNKLDVRNTQITEFCLYLKHMDHSRALEILKPYVAWSTTETFDSLKNTNGTLDTPTHSFAELPAAIMGYSELDPFSLQSDKKITYAELPNDDLSQKNNVPAYPNNHRLQPVPNDPAGIAHVQQPAIGGNKAADPGEEIVRMACVNNRKRSSISDQSVVNQLRLIMQITYNELKQASNNFSDNNILGNGGFASVYRGNWKGTEVAIKRLKSNLMDQALNELTIMNSYRIDNILPIYGISIDGPEACLVYQFMANGSLEDRLSCKNNAPPLTWNQRAQIGEGVAKGLHYLHTLRDKPMVHGDVKSANVLLDAQFIPKLGDFGLARQVLRGKKTNQTDLCTHCTVSSIHGTSVYLPNEYLRHKILSPAVDVYSYGIVLLEMATGRRAYDGKRLLLEVVKEETSSMSQGQISYSLKDSRLADDTLVGLKIWYELLIKLGLNCAQEQKSKRPEMGQVLARFVDFRNSNEPSKTDFGSTSSNVPYSGLNGTSTARTLTPDLTTLAGQEPTPATRGNPPKLPIVANNSALMSVEEESESHVERPEKLAGAPPSVEAMIPLLTELGIKANQYPE